MNVSNGTLIDSSFIFSERFIVVRVTLDLGNACCKACTQPCTGRKTIACSFTPRGNLDLPVHVSECVWRKPENPKETHTDKSGENTKIQTDRIQGLSYEM